MQGILKDIQEASDPQKVSSIKRVFKESDIEGVQFAGVAVPKIREIAKAHCSDIPFDNLHLLDILLISDTHEEKICALLILVEMLQRAKKAKSEADMRRVVRYYCSEGVISRVNNWDLVDLSSYKILGEYSAMYEDGLDIIYKFAISKNPWERRISIVSTFTFIKVKELSHTVKIAKLLLSSKEEIVQKAVGWMLREAGKKSRQTLTGFLDVYAPRMESMALSYALEHLSADQKKRYRHLKKTFKVQ